MREGRIFNSRGLTMSLTLFKLPSVMPTRTSLAQIASGIGIILLTLAVII